MTVPLRKLFHYVLNKIQALSVNWQWDCEVAPEKCFLSLPLIVFDVYSGFTEVEKNY